MTIDQSKYLLRIFTPCVRSKLYPRICHDYENEMCTENVRGLKCPNDLSTYNIQEGIKTDDISASLCGKFRLNKTEDKTKLTAFKWSSLAIILSSIILLLIFHFVYKISIIIFVAPLIAIMILFIILSSIFSKISKTTAYDVAEAKKQQS